MNITDKLNAMTATARTGGKGSARRKKKVIHKTAATDEKKLQLSLKKLSVNNIPGIEEVNMIKDDGHAENKQLTDMFPGIINQLGAEQFQALANLKNLTSKLGGLGEDKEMEVADDDDDDVPELVENFDEASKDDL